MFKRIKASLTPTVVIAIAVLISLVTIGVSYAVAGNRPQAEYVTPKTEAITGEIDSTGTVKAAESVDLSFEASGRITQVLTPVGTHVARGQTLATLSGEDTEAALAQARANLAVQQAKLDGLEAGARPEDIAVSQTAVSGAQMSVTQAKASVLSAANTAYVQADDAIHNKVDQFMTNPRTTSPILSLSFTNPQTQTTVESDRVTMESLLSAWNNFIQSQPSDATQADIPTVIKTTRQNVSQLSAYLDTVAAGLSTVTPSAYLSTETIQGYQSSVSLARTNLATSLSALNAAASAEQGAEAGLASAQSQLQFKQAGASQTDIEAQQAQIDAAQAAIDAAQAQSAKTVLVAPISGTVTRNDAHVGAIAAPGISLISVDSDSRFQIETYVSEVDVGHIHVGDTANIMLDAYPNDALRATVVTIDPAATVQGGVASYKVTLQFSDADSRVQAGLTGNVHITTEQKGQALTVPSSAIITQGDKQYVLTKLGSANVLTPVTVGIESADGETEILSGLTPDAQVRAFGNQ